MGSADKSIYRPKSGSHGSSMLRVDHCPAGADANLAALADFLGKHVASR